MSSLRPYFRTCRKEYFKHGARKNIGPHIPAICYQSRQLRECLLFLQQGLTHEGHGGYARGTYKRKRWLMNTANRVQRTANNYAAQLKRCS